MIPIEFIRVGNHFYPNIEHENVNQIVISPEIEHVLNNNVTFLNSVTIFLEEVGSIINENDAIIIFDECDLKQYLYGKIKPQDIHFTINDKTYFISTQLYSLLEKQFQINFSNTLYKIIL